MSALPRVLVTRGFPASAALATRFASSLDIDVASASAPLSRAELLRRVSSVDALLCWSHDRVDDELLAHAPRLRIVANYGVGYDSVDVDACTRRGVWVSNTPDVLTDATADTAMHLIVSVVRGFSAAEANARAGRWTTGLAMGNDLRGKVLGVVGMGRIGREVASRARAFRMSVVYHNRTQLDTAIESALAARYCASLDELLRVADVVTLHCPLGSATRHLLGARELAAMKPGALLINTARGAVVDEHALVDALASGALGGAGLDVFEDEPHIPDALLRHPRVTVLPHVGSFTEETRAAMGELALRNIERLFAAGRPVTPVNEPSGV